jgi:hypothetical protein
MSNNENIKSDNDNTGIIKNDNEDEDEMRDIKSLCKEIA